MKWQGERESLNWKTSTGIGVAHVNKHAMLSFYAASIRLRRLWPKCNGCELPWRGSGHLFNLRQRLSRSSWTNGYTEIHENNDSNFLLCKNERKSRRPVMLCGLDRRRRWRFSLWDQRGWMESGMGRADLWEVKPERPDWKGLDAEDGSAEQETQRKTCDWMYEWS